MAYGMALNPSTSPSLSLQEKVVEGAKKKVESSDTSPALAAPRLPHLPLPPLTCPPGLRWGEKRQWRDPEACRAACAHLPRTRPAEKRVSTGGAGADSPVGARAGRQRPLPSSSARRGAWSSSGG